jgi:hypothetical protein
VLCRRNAQLREPRAANGIVLRQPLRVSHEIRRARELREQRHVVEREPGQEESLADALTARFASLRPRAGSLSRLRIRPAHSSTDETRKPLTQSSIWSGIPPTRSATNRSFLPERFGNDEAEILA